MRYSFGECQLLEQTRELLVAGKPHTVEPQVFDLLLHLVRERDRCISQEELVDVVWKGRIVSDSAISARISAARAAIGDDGKRQDWIRTIPRRGFRFIGLVEVDGPRSPPPASTLTRQRLGFCRSADGIRIAHATSGDGYPLLKAGHWLTHLDHDWHSPIWRPLLDRLNRNFQVIRYDQRGNGLSDWEVADFSLDRFVDDLEAVADAIAPRKFALYGSSQGVPIAIAYAARHPERVSHLVLHGGYEQGRLVRGSDADRQQAEAILTLIRHGWGKRGSAFIEAFSTLFIPDGSREQIESLAILQRETTSPQNAALLRAAVDSFDVSELLGLVRAPTLVIHARDDGVQPLEQGRRLAARIANCEFVMLESRNHVILPQEGAWPVLFDEIERFVLAG